MSTALNEIGYPKIWVDAQLSHRRPQQGQRDLQPCRVRRAAATHDAGLADRLDLFEQNKVKAASTPLPCT
ncbi:hypothetical protein P4050_35915 [Pseudomonas aeruginosa]|nr:hypothetical protein [Pseudomonas aeruginosa]